MSAYRSPHGKTVVPLNNSGTATASRNPAGAPALKDGQLSRDGRFRWSAGWGKWVPLTQPPVGREPLPGPLESGPLEPETLCHDSFCECKRCVNAGQRYADYLKNRDLWNNGGLK